ncbi:MAG: hypothetical protein FAF03_11580 [Epsilonproteobacteria bacterium]|nr:hypothetical protein [Campylobacterota bacterium]
MVRIYGYWDLEDTEVWVKSFIEEAVHYHEIDLRECQTEEEIVLAFGKVFKGDDRDGLVRGRSLDALNDVCRDYYLDSWRRYDTVVVRGWEHANKVNFKSCQVILSILSETYLERLKWKLEDIFDENEPDTLESAEMIDELERGHQIHIFMY